MNDMTVRKAWDRRPNETAKQYAAFQVYYQLHPYGEGEERRNIANVAKKLGLSATARLSEWSSMNDWAERAMAYDAQLATVSLEVIESELADYQQSVITSLGTQIVALNKILDKKMKKLLEEDEADATDLKKVIEAVRIKDDLARRIGRMPTQFTTERAEEEEPEQRVYVIGGK